MSKEEIEREDKQKKLIEIARKRYRDLELLNPRHELLSLFDINEFELRKGNRGIKEKYNFGLINYIRSVRAAIGNELERKLREYGLLEMMKAYF